MLNSVQTKRTGKFHVKTIIGSIFGKPQITYKGSKTESLMHYGWHSQPWLKETIVALEVESSNLLTNSTALPQVSRNKQ